MLHMAGNRAEVLPLYDPPRQKAYRSAIAKIIRNIKSARDLTNVELAEEIGCSAETISNAENENNDLSAVTFLRLGYYFGEDALAPALELFRRSHAEPKSLGERLDEHEANWRALRREIGV